MKSQFTSLLRKFSFQSGYYDLNEKCFAIVTGLSGPEQPIVQQDTVTEKNQWHQ